MIYGKQFNIFIFDVAINIVGLNVAESWYMSVTCVAKDSLGLEYHKLSRDQSCLVERMIVIFYLTTLDLLS